MIDTEIKICKDFKLNLVLFKKNKEDYIIINFKMLLSLKDKINNPSYLYSFVFLNTIIFKIYIYSINNNIDLSKLDDDEDDYDLSYEEMMSK